MIRLIIFVLFLVTVNSLKKGDNCTITKTNSSGICTPFSKCKLAVDDLRKQRILPQACGSGSGSIIFVCCPDSRLEIISKNLRSEEKEEEEEECSYPPIAITVNRNEYQSKAWKKCIDLADNIFPCRYMSFSLGAKKSRVDTCGHPPAQLIIGGTPAKTGEFPHMVALGYNNSELNQMEWDCGGTLISEQWIMSAAHCLFHRTYNVSVSKARIGEIKLDGEINPRYLFDIIEKISHPGYVGNQVYNDITLLKIDRPVTYSDTIRPACLHVGNSINENKAIATGFGVTNVDLGAVSKSNELLKVTVHKFTHEECSMKYTRLRKSPKGVIHTQICYGSRNESKDTCQGDSGGPLQIYNPGVYCTHIVIGVTSIGKLCGTPGTPGIYTKVSSYIPWIESVVWPN